jgi:CBS domain containing-hemolysin-like protein
VGKTPQSPICELSLRYSRLAFCGVKTVLSILSNLQALEIETAETLLRLGILVGLIFIVAFFVAAELAIVSASRSEISHLAEQTTDPQIQAAAAMIRHAHEHLDEYLSVTQTGTTASSLLLGWLGEGATVHWIEPWMQQLPIGHLPATISTHTIAVGLAFLFVTYIEIVLGELVPKVLATNAPERTALALIRPLKFCSYLFFPALVVMNASVRWITGWILRQRDGATLPAASMPFVQVDAHTVRLPGAIDLQTLNTRLDLPLPDHEAYTTLAGFMVYQLGRLPLQDDRVQWGEFELEAVRVIEGRVEMVLLRQITRPLLLLQAEPELVH